MRFPDAERALAGVPFMSPWQGRRLYDHLRETGAREVLELGTAFGASAGYMAAAVAANGGGRVVTVDRFRFEEPAPEETLDRLGLRDLVEFVRVPDSSYDWWLAQLVRSRTDAAGNVAPCFDFCYLDGAHELTVDGLAVVLVERLLREGGWLLLDDLDWTFEAGSIPAGATLSEAEVREPHVRLVWELVVRGSGAWDSMREDAEGGWGWARKGTGTRRLTLEVTRRERSVLAQRVELAARRTAARVRGAR